MERFEDSIAWQKARALNRAVYATTRGPKFAKDFGLCRQIQRASVSTMASIAEGFDRHRDNEFHQLPSVAKGSVAEVRSHLYAAFDVGYLSDEQFQPLRSDAEEVSRLIAGLRASIDRKRRAISDNRQH